jgi:general secretion pathway protein K
MQKGVALLQVLILSTILSIVLLSMNFQTREHLKLANAVNTYVDTNLLLQSVEAEVTFDLLTNEWMSLSRQDRNNKEKVRWNFHGQDFELSGVNVNIQDTSGLLNLTSPDVRLISRLTNDSTSGVDIAAAIADWQDDDDQARLNGAEQDQYPATIQVRNSPIQYVEELQLIHGMTPELYRKLVPLMSFFTKGINVNQQPDVLWQLEYPVPVAEELIKLRKESNLSSSSIERVSGKEISEFSRFGVGPVFRMRFTASGSNVKLSRELTMRFSPYQPTPVELYEFRTRSPMVEPLDDGF